MIRKDRPASEKVEINPVKTVIRATKPYSSGTSRRDRMMVDRKVMIWVAYVYPPRTMIFLNNFFRKLNRFDV